MGKEDESLTIELTNKPEEETRNTTGVLDPGAQEGVKKDPRVEQDKLTPETPRFQEIYRELKTANRTIEKLEKKLDEKGSDAKTEALIKGMREHNESLVKALKDGMIVSDGKTEDDETLKGHNDQLVSLRAQKKTAREQANFELETELDDKIVDVKVDIRELKKGIKDKKAKKPEDVKKPGDADAGLSADDQAEFDFWVSENPWFNTDQKKRAAAGAYEKRIIKEPEFTDSSFAEVLEEVSKRVKEKFKPAATRNTVESGGEHSTRLPAGTVQLNSTEVDIAKGLGISLEKYAQQKAIRAQH